jgi:uncharacterized protein
MKTIVIAGMAGSGKTAIALGLALKFREQGINPAYFKPIGSPSGPHRQDDEDVLLLKEVLSLPHDPQVISPVRLGPYYQSVGQPKDKNSLRETIMAAWKQVSQNVDTVVIDSSLSPYTAASLGLDAVSLARALGAALLYAVRPEDDFSLDQCIFYNQAFHQAGVPLLGNIFNHVDRTLLDKTRGVYAPILAENGFPLLGVIPKKAEIASPTVQEYYRVLGGELLTGETEGMSRIVEDVVVGSMTIESALGYLRRAPNKAVITGGDRSDMAVTALETSTSVLILTGGLYPDVGVLTRAIEKKVPVILVHYDTYTAIERLHLVNRRIRPGDEQGIRVAGENINTYCNWQAAVDYIRS